MKYVRNAAKTSYRRVNNSEAEDLVTNHGYKYTTKSAYRSWMNRTRMPYSAGKEFPGNRSYRKWYKEMKKRTKPRVSNADSTDGTKKLIQRVLSEPGKIFVERYLTKTGKDKMVKENLTEKEALAKYGKNRYEKNPNAVIVKALRHNPRNTDNLPVETVEEEVKESVSEIENIQKQES